MLFMIKEILYSGFFLAHNSIQYKNAKDKSLQAISFAPINKYTHMFRNVIFKLQ